MGMEVDLFTGVVCVHSIVIIDALGNSRDEVLIKDVSAKELVAYFFLGDGTIGVLTDEVSSFIIELVVGVQNVLLDVVMGLWAPNWVPGGFTAEPVQDLLKAGCLGMAASGLLTALSGVEQKAGSSGVGVGIFIDRFHGTLHLGLLDERLAVT